MIGLETIVIKATNIFITSPTTKCTTLNGETNATNTFDKFCDVFSLTLKKLVNLSKPLHSAATCSPVTFGIMALIASVKGFTKLTIPCITFFNPFNKAVRPPASFQACNMLFLASDILPIKPVRTSDIPDHNSLASSKSPIIICQV